MTKKIKIKVGIHTFQAELYPTPTTEMILPNLPLKGKVHTWGEEVYFTIPLHIPSESDARTIVEPGELGYWPAGNAFCIFFGRTPVSEGTEPRAYSPVNVFGKIMTDLSALKAVQPGEAIEISYL